MAIADESVGMLAVHDVDSPDLRAVFERDGVVLVRNLLSAAEVAELRRNIARYRKWLLKALPADWSRRESDGTLRGMYFLERVDPYFAAFGGQPRFAAIVERITGWPATFASMETFHKPARVGSASLVHQDGIYYVGTPTIGVNMWIALDDATRDNGALEYWVGTHTGGLRPHTGTPGDPYFKAMPADDVTALGAPSYAELPSGSASFHHDMIVHGSAPNRSGRDRLAIAATYTLDSTRRG